MDTGYGTKLNTFSTIGLKNMDSPVKMDSLVKSAPGAKWTHSAPVDLGKIDVSKTMDLLSTVMYPEQLIIAN